MRYALRLVRTTRVGETDGAHETPAVVRDYVSWGAGPRASEYLILGAKARALFAGQTCATPEHIREVAVPVLRHRVLLNFNAEADQVTTEDVIRGLIEGVPVEESPAAVRAQMDDVYG
jgi:MoxR-like ATPase